MKNCIQTAKLNSKTFRSNSVKAFFILVLSFLMWASSYKTGYAELTEIPANAIWHGSGFEGSGHFDSSTGTMTITGHGTFNSKGYIPWRSEQLEGYAYCHDASVIKELIFTADGGPLTFLTDGTDYFNGLSHLEKIEFNVAGNDSSECFNFDVSEPSATGSIANMFAQMGTDNGNKKFEVDLTHFDFSNVTSCLNMFSMSTGVSKVIFPSSDYLSNCTSTHGMFYACSSLTEIENLDYFDTNFVTDAFIMFEECESLSSLTFKAGTTNFAACTDIRQMFNGCSALSEINNLDTFKTDNVTSASQMFNGCNSLTQLSFGTGGDFENCTDMSSMFNGCSKLTKILGSTNLNPTNLLNSDSMFAGCEKLLELDISNINLSHVTDADQMFNNCSSLGAIKLINTDGCNSLASCTNCERMFEGCNALKTIEGLDKFNTKLAQSAWGFFNYNKAVKCIKNISDKTDDDDEATYYIGDDFTFENATNIKAMFYYCENLEEVDMSNFDLDSATVTESFIDDSSKVYKIILPKTWNSLKTGALPANEGKSWYVYDKDDVCKGVQTEFVSSSDNAKYLIKSDNYSVITSKVNDADSDYGICELLEGYKNELGLSDWSSLKTFKKQLITNYLINNKPQGGYADSSELLEAYNAILNEVSTLSSMNFEGISDKQNYTAGEKITLSIGTIKDQDENDVSVLISNLYACMKVFKKGDPNDELIDGSILPSYEIDNCEVSHSGTYFFELSLDSAFPASAFGENDPDCTLTSCDINISVSNPPSGGRKKKKEKTEEQKPEEDKPEVITPVDTIEKVEMISSNAPYIRGYDDHTFKPHNNMTRAEFCTIIASSCKDYVNSSSNYNELVDLYPDVRKDFWYTSPVGFCLEKGILKGYDDGFVRPDDYITRGEVSKILYLIFEDELKEVCVNSFESELEGEWYFGYADKLIKAGVIKGYDDGTFKGDKEISRCEIVILLNRLLGRTFDDVTTAEASKIESMFSDVSRKSWYFIDVARAAIGR